MTDTYDNFKSCLNNGNKAEKQTIKLLQSLGHIAEKNQSTDINRLKEYDIVYTGNTGQIKTIEVKRDSYTDRTGNICLEYSHYNSDSGILATKADYLFYFTDSYLYVFNVQSLKRFFQNEFIVFNHELNDRYQINGNTKSILVPEQCLYALGVTYKKYKRNGNQYEQVYRSEKYKVY